MIYLRKKALVIFLCGLLAVTFICPASAAVYTTLEYGSRGEEVVTLQNALNALGYDTNGVDGRFGKGTLNAVVAFQGKQGLKADGKAGTQTLTKLYALSAAASSSGAASGTLAYGDSGAEVKRLQQALKDQGYYTGTVDGKFGAGTENAVKAFQRANNLTRDGRAGAQTLGLLYSAANAGTSSSGNQSSTAYDASVMTRTLRKNCTGADVDKVQKRLVELNYLSAASGVYDSATILAVSAFQKRSGLTADGFAGARTFTVLFSQGALPEKTETGSVTVPTTYTTLRLGAAGAAVKALQTYLASLHYSVKVTSTYDTQTVAAVQSFQRINGLTADGLAGKTTQSVLYSGNAVKYSASADSPSASSSSSVTPPKAGQVKLMHWYNEVKPLLRGTNSIDVYDPATGYSFKLHLYSLGRHADVEPLTAQDTANMMAAFGGVVTWNPKFVYVRLPNGQWTAATMHNVAHGGQSIKNNNFNGQNCVHFLRDMDEVTKADPSYGVSNQEVLRKEWKKLTGETIA